jgi:peptide methionine sulfoxide reductase msrA/msrB
MKLMLVLFTCLFSSLLSAKWEVKDKATLKKNLSPLEYQVTQHEGTEPAFNNKYWNEKRPGIYVDVTTGEPLFSSLDKYDSGTGWPSFTKSINEKSIDKKLDPGILGDRTEVRSKTGNAHLGHIFDDGPKDKGGKRFCINSAALKFIPLEEMEKAGYGEYMSTFNGALSSQPVETAVLAGGCFWGVEELIRKLPGVISTEVGYTGGNSETPIYATVKTGSTGHAESIEVKFDPTKLSYKDLLQFFFRIHDPTTVNQQGNDKGTQYRSAIFFANEQQKKMAEEVKAAVEKAGKWKKPIVTEIVPLKKFYSAESFHQDYLQKNPGGYTCHWVRD